ncbi:MAG: ABC transporter permease [Bacteroidales bacterium]
MWAQIKTEAYKVCHQPLIIIFLALPILLFVYEVSFSERLMERANLWQEFFNLGHSAALYSYLMAKISIFNLILLVLFCFQYVRMEQQNSCTNALFTLPVKTGTVYFAKVTALWVVVLLNNLIIFATLSTAVLFGKADTIPSSLPFLYYSAGCIMLASFHYTLANLTRNLIYYLFIFIALYAASFLLESPFLPHSYCNGFVTGYPETGTRLVVYFLWVTPVYTVFFTILGYVTFKRINL